MLTAQHRVADCTATGLEKNAAVKSAKHATAAGDRLEHGCDGETEIMTRFAVYSEADALKFSTFRTCGTLCADMMHERSSEAELKIKMIPSRQHSR